MSKKSPRKYQPVWNQLKEEVILEVDLPLAHEYTQAQLLKMMKTVRKAVINEKCRDLKYKRFRPWSELTITFVKDIDSEEFIGTIRFKLVHDTTDCTLLFTGTPNKFKTQDTKEVESV
jgi:homoaconitase/3-isopropylmalate dehydratase large subunit